MIKIYRFNPGWNVPCLSPFVTKAIYYLRMAEIPHEVKTQNFSRLDQDAPYGKLPYIEDDGVKVASHPYGLISEALGCENWAVRSGRGEGSPSLQRS